MAQDIQLTLEPLSTAAFAEFGEVVQIDESARHFSINGGKIERYYDLAGIEIGADNGGVPIVSLATCLQITELPLNIDMVERHPLASQMIFPLHQQPMIVVVAPQGETVTASSLRAFYSNGQQGVNFHKGTWHLPLIALQEGQTFLMVDRGGKEKNCDEFHFDAQVKITLPDVEL